MSGSFFKGVWAGFALNYVIRYLSNPDGLLLIGFIASLGLFVSFCLMEVYDG